MKRLCLILYLTFFFMILTGCDYPEKSLQQLDSRTIPEEVTMDFKVIRGSYAPIIYESSHPDVLQPQDDYTIKVNQQEEDVVVTLTARVKRKKRVFTVKVLKKGSEPTPREKVMMAKEQLQYPKWVLDTLVLPVVIGDVELRYEYYFSGSYRPLLNYDELERIDDQYVIRITPDIIHQNYDGVNDAVDLKVYFELKNKDETVYKESVKIAVKIYDNPEQLLSLVNDEHIPDEVTMDFTVPIDDYGLIVYESSDPSVLLPQDDGIIRVFQQDEDVDVILTARAGEHTKTFTITVLRMGLEPTLFEKVKLAKAAFIYPKEVESDFYLPSKLHDVTLSYRIHCKIGYCSVGVSFVEPERVGNSYKIPITEGHLYGEWIYVDVIFTAGDENTVVRDTMTIQIRVQ